MNQSVASCPAALSFIFKYCPNDDPLKAGSVGVGCTIDKKVTATVSQIPVNSSISPLHSSIRFNNQPINFPTVDQVVKSLAPEPIEVSIQTPLSLGCGFGISGASALGTAFAIHQLFNLKKSNEELAQIAHTAEIKNKTGLGTIGTQITGGFLLKESPGLPVKARRLPFEGQKLYATILGPLTTPSVLENKAGLQRIAQAADRAMERILEMGSWKLEAGSGSEKRDILKSKTSNHLTSMSHVAPPISRISLQDILDISYDFVKESRLLNDPKMENVINDIRKAGGHVTMAILGRVVLSNQKPNKATKYRIEELTVTNNFIQI